MLASRFFKFLFSLLVCGSTLCSTSLEARGLGDLFSATVPVSFQHPPDLGFTVDSIAFADPNGECSREFVDLLIEDFLRSGVEVIERERIEAILQEIDLSASGYVRPEDMKPLGEVMGASALVFVNVQRCATQCKRSHKTYTGKNGSTTTYYSTSTAHFKSSVRVVDTLTGRVHSARVVEENKEDTNSSRQGYPEYPDTFVLKDAAIHSGVVKVHRMLLPWWEITKMRFFKDEKCGLEKAFRLVKIQDLDGALERALKGVETCKSLPKPKPKLLARAHYNVGVVQLLQKDYDSALTFFREAHAIRPAGRMQDGVTETQRGLRLAAAMDSFRGANGDRLAGSSHQGAPARVSPVAPAPSPAAPPTASRERPASERLKELETLLEQGLLTEAEFRQMRQKILAKI